MARKKMRRDRFDLTPQEQKIANTRLTREIVHTWLKQATEGDPSITVLPVDSPEVGLLMQVLAFCPELVARQRQSWAPSARNFDRFADLCRGLGEVVPLLKAEVTDALRLVDHTPPDVTDSPPMLRDWLVRDWLGGLQTQPVFAEALALLDSLGRILQGVERNPILMQVSPPADDWRNYADGIRVWFNRAVIRTGARSEEPIGNPWYAFVVLYSPFVTGEHVAFSAVRNHFTRDRPNTSRQRRRWYRDDA